jgi:hypothetical protein
MPSNVVWFERLMIGSILAGLAGVLLLWQREGTASLTGIAFGLTLIVVNFSLMLLLIWLIARRRIGWLRHVFAGLFLLGVWHAVPDIPAEFATTPADGMLNVLRLALQGIAFVLVYTGNARAWFGKTATASMPPMS